MDGGAGGGGGDHLDGGGGYSGGTAQLVSMPYQVVNGDQNGNEPTVYAEGGTGGSYFSRGMYDSRISVEIDGKKNYVGELGGQGGNIFDSWWVDSGGDGGIAGKGGKVTVSETSLIYAFNGNQYTDKKPGHDNPNMSPNNQCPIYIQNGVLLAIYKNNCWWGVRDNYNYDFFVKLLGKSYVEESVKTETQASNRASLKNILIRKSSSSNLIKSGYINPVTSNSFGIGSGAGYIEISNGTYEIDSTLN